MGTANWAMEVSWEIDGTSCASDKAYTDSGIHEQTCCIPSGSYTLKCQDAFGDGWRGSYLVIDGNEYCRGFNFGKLKTANVIIGDHVPTEPVTPTPTRSPVTQPSSVPTFGPTTRGPTNAPGSCRVQTVKLYTLLYANEIEWDLLGVSGCSSFRQEYENDSVYELECCIPDETFTLKCMNSIGDGFHRGYLEIEGNKFCQDHFGFEKSVEISFPLEQPKGCVDAAPSHVCEKIMGRGWCDHVEANQICSQTCNQC